MYNQTLHHTRKHFCYCLLSFSIENILERHSNDCLKINGKQTINMTKKGETVKFKNYDRRTK